MSAVLRISDRDYWITERNPLTARSEHIRHLSAFRIARGDVKRRWSTTLELRCEVPGLAAHRLGWVMGISRPLFHVACGKDCGGERPYRAIRAVHQ